MPELKSYLVEAHIIKVKDESMEFLLLKRSDNEIYPGIWQMVTGSIKNEEKAYETAVREINEETGLPVEKLWVVPHVNSFYSHEKDHVCFIPVFVALTNTMSRVKLSSEHSEYKWLPREEAKELLAWDGQKKSVDLIYEYFMNRLSTLNFIQINL